nr:unnamed protein product [Callosobruchus analis]
MDMTPTYWEENSNIQRVKYESIENTASQKLGVLFRCRKLHTPEQLLLLYKAQIRPSLEYCSHLWGCAPKHTLKLLDAIQSRAVKTNRCA